MPDRDHDDPRPPDAGPVADLPAVAWALDRLRLPGRLVPLIAGALARQRDPAAAGDISFGLEIHHDGSGRVDLAVPVVGPAGQVLVVGDGRLTVATDAMAEFDIPPSGGPVSLAGTFHRIIGGTLPAALSGLPTPILVSHLVGRDGAYRLILPVPDVAGLRRLADALVAAGLPVSTRHHLGRAERFLTGPGTLRIGVDYRPESRPLGPRLGLEIAIDPSRFDLRRALATAGVPAGSISAMDELCGLLPAARVHDRTVTELADLSLMPRQDAIGFTHLSVSWDDGDPARTSAAGGDASLKSYLLVSSGTPLDPDARRDALVRANGATWPQVLAWAANQFPLRRPDPDAERRLEAWRDAVDPHRTGAFEDRLTRDGLAIDTARVAVSGASTGHRPDPLWWAEYRMLVSAMSSDPLPHVTDAVDWLAEVNARLPGASASRIPFAHALWPIADAAWDRLCRRLADLGMDLAADVDAAARDDLRVGLLVRLSSTAATTLSEIMDHDLTFGQRLLARIGPLPAEPERVRYATHCRWLVRGGMSDVLLAHPVLGGLLATTVRQWDDHVGQVLQRLQADRGLLAETFGIDIGAAVTGASLGAGDTHNDGRSVCLVRIGEHALVYKPRDTRLESLYESVAALVGSASAPLRAPRTLPRSDADGRYGWVEHIDHRLCASGDEVQRFYRNAGRTLAVLHALAATDCHAENLIAHGDQLVLIDAETLFDPAGTPAALPTRAEGTDPTVATPATVLRIGLLPTWLWLDGQRLAIDMSALGVGAAADARRPAVGWRSMNDDAMCWGPIEPPPWRVRCLPVPPGEANPLADHVDDLVAGFEEAYATLLRVREPLQALVAGASHLMRRAVVRPTYVYATLLAQSCAPTALTSVAARGIVLEQLTRAYLPAEAVEQWPLVRAEQEALSRLDVPYVEAPVTGGRTQWHADPATGTGAVTQIDGWPDIDGIAEARRRIADLDEADGAWQATVIRAAIAASRVRLSQSGGGVRLGEASVVARDRDPREVADEAMTAVAGAGFATEAGLTWLGAAVLPDGEHVNLQGLGSGLYDGRAGLAIALTRWARSRRDDEDARTADRIAAAALDPLLTSLQEPDAVQRLLTASGPGLAGAGGLLRAVDHLVGLGAMDQADADRADATIIGAISPGWLQADRVLDHMVGVAGLIAPLTRRLGGEHRTRARDLLGTAADLLVERQEARDDGWRTLPASQPLTGLAHGAAGIGLALAEAALALDDARYLTAAARGLSYEDSTYDPAARNWPDFREGVASGGFMLGWCAGAPGIVLTRHRLLDLLPDHEQADAWRAMLIAGAERVAVESALPRDHVCCGTLGMVAVLRTVARRPDVSDSMRTSWLAAADRQVTEVLTRPGESLPRSVLGAAEPGIPMPGLMTGLPGAALVLLEPDPTPWVTDLLL